MTQFETYTSEESESRFYRGESFLEMANIARNNAYDKPETTMLVLASLAFIDVLSMHKIGKKPVWSKPFDAHDIAASVPDDVAEHTQTIAEVKPDALLETWDEVGVDNETLRTATFVLHNEALGLVE